VPWRERLRNWLIVGGLALLLGLVLVGFPPLVEAARERLGIRGVAAALLAAGVPLALALRGRRGPAPLGAGALLPPLVLALAALTGTEVFLRLVPAAVCAAVALAFAASLGAPQSLIELAIRALVPAAPDFVAGYCRGLTLFWAVFFAASSLLGAWLAIVGPLEGWRAWTGWGNLAAMLAVSGPEFLIRKTWFRYYFHGGPFDRLWSRLFPAENTERGRRSLEAIRRWREEHP
jgi:uncharacterized membrane protein